MHDLAVHELISDLHVGRETTTEPHNEDARTLERPLRGDGRRSQAGSTRSNARRMELDASARPVQRTSNCARFRTGRYDDEVERDARAD